MGRSFFTEKETEITKKEKEEKKTYTGYLIFCIN